jgi:hypothetical protein
MDIEKHTEILEIINQECSFHCVCYKNPHRHQNMKTRFETLGLNLQIYEGVPPTDHRISITETRQISQDEQRLWSIVYGHLDMIQLFYDSGKRYGFFCEDDIVVSTQFPIELPQIMYEFDQMRLDILLLGYMITYKIKDWMTGYSSKCDFTERPYTYHNYPHGQWGAHLYMLNRAGAKKILDEYSHGWADKNYGVEGKPFSPDWTITKTGNRALITPLMAVEDGKDSLEHYSHEGQYRFHMDTFTFNSDSTFI